MKRFSKDIFSFLCNDKNKKNVDASYFFGGEIASTVYTPCFKPGDCNANLTGPGEAVA
jgi:hypothetical protein